MNLTQLDNAVNEVLSRKPVPVLPTYAHRHREGRLGLAAKIKIAEAGGYVVSVSVDLPPPGKNE